LFVVQVIVADAAAGVPEDIDEMLGAVLSTVTVTEEVA
jgi:hypothetical protein